MKWLGVGMPGERVSQGKESSMSPAGEEHRDRKEGGGPWMGQKESRRDRK